MITPSLSAMGPAKILEQGDTGWVSSMAQTQLKMLRSSRLGCVPKGPWDTEQVQKGA